MFLGLLTNWRIILFGLSILSLIGTVTYIKYLNGRIDTLKVQKEQAQTERDSCFKNFKTNTEVSNVYQKNLSSLRSQLNKLKRVQPNCILPQTSGRSNATSPGAELSSRNGVSADWLYDFAGRAEEARLKLLGCQQWINAQ